MGMKRKTEERTFNMAGKAQCWKIYILGCL